MLNAIQFSDLVEPVIKRARAQPVCNTKGFSDRAASFVLERLGIATNNRLDAPSLHLSKCAWIDSQARSFFTLHPKGHGIEVDSGLSTRFHRISEQLDWPRFYWNAINPLDVNDCLRFVFPNLDNHHLVGVNAPLLHWHEHIAWTDAAPRLVIVGEAEPVKDWAIFTGLLANIQQSLTEQSPSIDLIFCHSVKEFDRLYASCSLPVTVLTKHKKFIGQRAGLLRHLDKLFPSKHKQREYIHHFLITRQTVRRG